MPPKRTKKKPIRNMKRTNSIVWQYTWEQFRKFLFSWKQWFSYMSFVWVASNAIKDALMLPVSFYWLLLWFFPLFLVYATFKEKNVSKVLQWKLKRFLWHFLVWLSRIFSVFTLSKYHIYTYTHTHIYIYIYIYIYICMYVCMCVCVCVCV